MEAKITLTIDWERGIIRSPGVYGRFTCSGDQVVLWTMYRMKVDPDKYFRIHREKLQQIPGPVLFETWNTDGACETLSAVSWKAFNKPQGISDMSGDSQWVMTKISVGPNYRAVYDDDTVTIMRRYSSHFGEGDDIKNAIMPMFQFMSVARAGT